MSIDGAGELDQVDEQSWIELAGDAGYRPGFVTRTVNDVLERAAVEAPVLISTAEHDNETVRKINERIQRLAGH